MQFLLSLSRRRYLWLIISITVCSPYLVQGQEAGTKTEAALRKWLKKNPEADANRDGTLTEIEALEFRKSAKTSNVERSAESNRGQMPTQTDVAYGEHERQKLDFWKATSELPTPVLIFFHGGSFKAGDKSAIQSRSILDECLKAGISVVSANYRLSTDSPAACVRSVLTAVPLVTRSGFAEPVLGSVIGTTPFSEKAWAFLTAAFSFSSR